MSTAEIQDIIDTFELFGDWDQRYHYLVEMGEQMPPLSDADRLEENLVKECMSTVHIAAHYDAEHPGRLRYSGDCDTAIIKGVVALLVQLFSGKTRDEIEDLDVDSLFEGLHLEEHLSPNRHVGVYAIVDKIKGQARALATQ
ncbi:MAG: SufE family protein [Pseudomonadota bacterium]|nr:SufE family protein [Pseudomonadota bacterium]